MGVFCRMKNAWWSNLLFLPKINYNQLNYDIMVERRKFVPRLKSWLLRKPETKDVFEVKFKDKANQDSVKAKKESEEKKCKNMKLGNDTVFRIASQMRKTNQDVVGDKCIRNDDGELSVSDDAKKQTWKEHYERLLNVEFPWDPSHLVQEDPIPGAPPHITVDMVSHAVNKMKCGKGDV